MLSNCGVGEDLRVPWTARRSNQSVLKEINPKCSLKGLMLKLKLQYFGHLMRRADSLEKTLMLRKIEDRRRGRQSMRWLNGITDSMDMNFSKLCEMVKDRKPGVLQFMELQSQTQLSDWRTTCVMFLSFVFHLSFWLLSVFQLTYSFFLCYYYLACYCVI